MIDSLFGEFTTCCLRRGRLNSTVGRAGVIRRAQAVKFGLSCHHIARVGTGVGGGSTNWVGTGKLTSSSPSWTAVSDGEAPVVPFKLRISKLATRRFAVSANVHSAARAERDPKRNDQPTRQIFDAVKTKNPHALAAAKHWLTKAAGKRRVAPV